MNKSQLVEENKTEEGIIISIISSDGKNVTQRSLSEFLKIFETPKQRDLVRTAICSYIRMNTKPTKTEKEIEDFRAVLMQDRRSSASYWNGDPWGSIVGVRDAEDWVKREIEKFKNS